MFSNQNEIKNEPKDPCLKSPHFNMQPFGAGPDILTEYLLGLEKINDKCLSFWSVTFRDTISLILTATEN